MVLHIRTLDRVLDPVMNFQCLLRKSDGEHDAKYMSMLCCCIGVTETMLQNLLILRESQ